MSHYGRFAHGLALARGTPNALLNGLPATLLDQALLSRVALKAGDQLDLRQSAFFPLSGLIAMAVLQEDGRFIEARLVGKESAAVSVGPLPEFGFVIAGGEAVRIELGEARGHELHQALFRAHGQAWLGHAAVQIACMAHHPARQRFATWLVCAVRQGGLRPIEIAQDELAQLLGLNRTSLSAIAKPFRQAGLIRYGRGVLSINDATGIQRQACACAQARLNCLGV